MKIRKSKSLTSKSNIARKATIETLKKRSYNIDSLSELFDEMSFKDCKNEKKDTSILPPIPTLHQIPMNTNICETKDVNVNNLIDQFGKKLEIVPSKKLYYNFPYNQPKLVNIKSLSNIKLNNFFRIIRLNKYFIEYNKSNRINQSIGEITEIDEIDETDETEV